MAEKLMEKGKEEPENQSSNSIAILFDVFHSLSSSSSLDTISFLALLAGLELLRDKFL